MFSFAPRWPRRRLFLGLDHQLATQTHAWMAPVQHMLYASLLREVWSSSSRDVLDPTCAQHDAEMSTVNSLGHGTTVQSSEKAV